MKKFLTIGLVFLFGILLASGVFARGSAESTSSATATHAKPYNVAVIIKATDSDFWQYLLVGAKNFAFEHPDLVKIKTYGPPSESDIAQQVSILENVVSTKPDGILISSTSSDATVPALEKAISEGIAVVTVDNKVHSDKIKAFLATNNKVGGALAADQLVSFIKANGKPLEGTVGLVSAYSGIQVLTDRDSGFADRLKELAPNITLLPARYTNNDITQALSVAEDEMTSQGSKLIGIFADNNHTGDGVARAITERNLIGKVAAVSFDSDPEEVSALKSGALNALILQDPYGMGYKGMQEVVTMLEGGTVPEYLDTGAHAVTKANMDQPDMQGLLNPMTLKKY